jgi:DNA-binding XRE family transcriptional regulator
MTDTPASRLRAAREAAGFKNASDFARKIDVPDPTYNAHENGSRGFKQPAAKRYAAHLNTSWQWLLIGDDSHPPSEVSEHMREFSRLTDTDKEAIRSLTRRLLASRQDR